MGFPYLTLAMLTFLGPNGAQVQMGRQTSHFRATPAREALLLPNYANNGYRQNVQERDGQFYIDVMVKNSQLASKIPARKVATLGPELRALEKRLNGSHHEYLAGQIAELFHWLRREIEYEHDFELNQTVAQVLQRGSADCVGFSNLAIHILEQMGVQARFVTGLAFKPSDRTVRLLEGDVLHRWVEIRYEDVGWVFADPAGKVNFVDATYMVLGVQGVHPLPQMLREAEGTQVRLVAFEDGLRDVGTMKGLDGRLRMRPNRLFLQP